MKYLWLGIVLGALVAAFVNPLLAIAILLSLIIIVLLVKNLDFGIIVLVFFFPYLGLVIDFGAFEELRQAPYLKDINAPFIDLYGLLLLAACGISTILKKEIFQPIPNLKSYLLFWLSGLVSLLKAPTVYFSSSLKYLARPFTFFYLVFFVTPIKIIKDKQLLDNVLWVFFVTGLLSGFNGLLGLLFNQQIDFPRASPFSFFGISFLGANHNLLAETLIATAPIGIILKKQWVKYAMFFQWIIALLTFARTAWIAVFIQVIVYLYFVKKGKIKSFLKETAPVIVLIAAMLLVLLAATFTESVKGSTLTRMDMARISMFYFEKSPWIGQGIGTFIPTLWQTKAYLLDYGDPLEAHGIIFKLMFEQGLFGLLAFAILAISILYGIVREYQKNKNIEVLAGLLAAVGSFSYQLLNTNYYNSKLWIPVAIAVVISKIYSKKV